jgi:hypothetical protein
LAILYFLRSPGTKGRGIRSCGIVGAPMWTPRKRSRAPQLRGGGREAAATDGRGRRR